MLVAIIFGPKIHIFIPKFGQNSNFILKSAYGGVGTCLGIIPRNKQSF